MTGVATPAPGAAPVPSGRDSGSDTASNGASPPGRVASLLGAGSRDPLTGGSLWWRILLVVLLVFGVAIRFAARSALWLDEAQSVAIAKLPLHAGDPAGTTMWTGLKQDGSPPLYYLFLHFWMKPFGTGVGSVRALSAVFGVLCIPPLYLLAKRVAGVRAARVTIVVFITSPFAIRFAAETRMYSLVVLLTALFGLALERTLRSPSWKSVVSLGICSGLLALTHYWTFYLLLTVGLWLIVRSVHGEHATRAHARWGLVGLISGAIVFSPWLKMFGYQSKHTGTPWGEPATLAAVIHAFGEWAGGPSVPGRLNLLLVGALIAFAVFGIAAGPRQILLDFRGHNPGRMLLGCAAGTLVVAVLAGQVFNTAYADRYTATAFVPFVLCVAVGTLTLSSPKAFRTVVAVVAALGLVASLQYIFNPRTQAYQVAASLNAKAGAGDVVLVCPDQLGPALARVVKPDVKLRLVPSYTSAERVDWVDYAARQNAADGAAIADKAIAEAGSHNVWLVTADGYKTYETLCDSVKARLASLRPHVAQAVAEKPKVYEHEDLDWFLRQH
jgi:mannosyltransferase